MEYIRNLFDKTIRWQHFWLIVIVVCVFGLHLATAIEFNLAVFDESYYINDAHAILNGQGTILLQHPPLGKLFIVEGIRIFGDNPLGWRIFAIFFGTASVILLYFICRRLRISQTATLIATFLFAFENLNFIQSGIAMLDVYCLTFMLGAILLFLHERLLLAGFLAGLSILAKMPGIFVLGIFLIFWLATNRKKWQIIVIPTLTAILTVPLLLPLIEYPIIGNFVNPVARIEQMYFHATGLTFDLGGLGIASRPWEWLSNYGTIVYNYNPQMIGMLSLTLSFLIIPSVIYMLYKSINGNRAALFSLAWFGCTFLPWVAICIIFYRLTYIYYFYPVIGAICIGSGLGIESLYKLLKTDWYQVSRIGRWGIRGYLILHMVVFILLSPWIPPMVHWLPI